MKPVPEQPSSPPLDPVPLPLLINARSRRGREHFQAALEALEGAGVAVRVLGPAGSQAHAGELIDAEVRAGAPAVIVGGGDGTLSAAVGRLAGSGTALGVLPLGTGNTFARSLGLPLDLAGAAGVIAGRSVQSVDLGRVNGRIFLNSVALGLSAELARRLGPQTKRRLGLLAWPLLGARLLWRHPPLTLRVTPLGGPQPPRSRTLHTHQLVVVNGRYLAGPLVATPSASLQDGQLNVLALGGVSPGSLLGAALGWALTGRSRQPGAWLLADRALRVESGRGPVRVSVDGEVLRLETLTLTLERRALRVIVPPGFVASEV